MISLPSLDHTPADLMLYMELECLKMELMTSDECVRAEVCVKMELMISDEFVRVEVTKEGVLKVMGAVLGKRYVR